MTIELIGTESLYQWDTGRRVVVSSEYEIKEIHFSSKSADEALVVAVNEDMTANIPNSLLQQTNALCVYAVACTENGRHSVNAESFKITKRARPSDYVYTETEILRYEDLKERIVALEEGGGDLPEKEITDMVNSVVTKAVTDSLQQAKESGEFKGDKGDKGAKGADGVSIISVSIKEVQ